MSDQPDIDLNEKPLEDQKSLPGQIFDKWAGLPWYLKYPLVVTAGGAAASTLGATALLASYLAAPEWTKRKASKLAYNTVDALQKGVGKTVKQIPAGGPMGTTLAASLSLSGPGVLLGHKQSPVMIKGDPAGAGIVFPFSREGLARFVNKVPFVPSVAGKAIRKFAPPDMYAGAELSLLAPWNMLSVGAKVDKSNVQSVREKLQLLKEQFR